VDAKIAQPIFAVREPTLCGEDLQANEFAKICSRLVVVAYRFSRFDARC
jgi:hypothetical protein